jgi:hypothetical protein
LKNSVIDLGTGFSGTVGAIQVASTYTGTWAGEVLLL